MIFFKKKKKLKEAFGLNVVDTSGVIAAVRAGDLDKLREALDNGGSVNARDASGQTALMMAVWADNTEMSRFLIARGADVNAFAYKYGSNALAHAAQKNNVEIARALLEGGANPNIRDNYGETPLIVAALMNAHEVTRVLLDYGADINIRDSVGKGRTALWVAEKLKHKECAAILREAGNKKVNTMARYIQPRLF